MKRWIQFVAALYPRSWREEFGEEFAALLDDVKPCWRVFGNVLGGAIRMQTTTGTDWMKVMVATAVFGAIVAWGMSFRIAPHYVSTAVMAFAPQPDPVRPVSREALRERAGERLVQLETQILSRRELSLIIQDPRLNLYSEERKRMPLLDVIEQMKHDIHIQALPSPDGDLAPIIFSITFSYPDQAKAQAAVRDLSAKFNEENANINRVNDDVYRDFWRALSESGDAKPAPPPPVGDQVRVLDSASLPTEAAGTNRAVFISWGAGLGLLSGLLAVLAIRGPRRFWQLARFALAGCILTVGASYPISNRFTSTAVMEISPPLITEDPNAPLAAVTPVAEFLRQTEPEVLSVQKLSKIIEDPRLNLYLGERGTKPIEEVVRSMLARDLRISPLSSLPWIKGAPTAFSISFTYPDRYKAQLAVQALMNAFDEQNQNRLRAEAAGMSVIRRGIAERKAGEMLDVLDTASLPVAPVWPNRLVIAAIGLALGLLVGTFKLRIQRPRVPVLQPA